MDMKLIIEIKEQDTDVYIQSSNKGSKHYTELDIQELKTILHRLSDVQDALIGIYKSKI